MRTAVDTPPNVARRRSLGFVRDSSGMTLIEVIMAIVIMTIIATAATGLAISSMSSTTTQQRLQQAVTVASQAMETVSAHQAATNPLTGVSYLLDGRSQADAEAAWAASVGVAGIGASYPGWDTRGTLPSVAIPFGIVDTRSGTDYTVRTLIGTCYQSTTAGTDHRCTRMPGFALSPPANTPAGWAPLTRVIVSVTWTAGTSCAAGCSYQTTSLFDPHADLEWNTHD